MTQQYWGIYQDNCHHMSTLYNNYSLLKNREFHYGVFIMTFLQYLAGLSEKEFKVLLVCIDKNYGWLATNCGGSSPNDLLVEATKRCLEGRRSFPKGQITKELARKYIIYSVVRGIVGNEYKKIKKEQDRLISFDNMPDTNDNYSLHETLASKDSEPSEQLHYEQDMTEIRNRITNKYPRRQPRLLKVFDLFVQGKSYTEIIEETDSNKSTVFEDIAFIKSITLAYIQE